MENIIDKALAFVENTFKYDYSGHDFFHTLRVYKTAAHLATAEHADLETVQLAALLHDVDDIKLSPETHTNKDRARQFLSENNIDGKTTELICQIIDEVSFKGTDSVIPSTLEGKCVQDADRLDAIGAIGIARAFAYGGNHNRVMYDPAIEPHLNMDSNAYRSSKSTTVNHFYEKLFYLAAMMNTSTAKQLAVSREAYMKGFIDEFMEEWNGFK